MTHARLRFAALTAAATCAITAFALQTMVAQPRLTRTEVIPVETSRRWTQPRFAPDGASIYFTASDFSGIWKHTLADRKTVAIVVEPGAGGAFTIAPDGRSIVYRRTSYPAGSRERVQEIVHRDLSAKTSTILATGRSLSAPAFADGKPTFIENGKQKNLSLRRSSANITILGIEETKIALNRNGVKLLLDPLGKGRYIWPALSPNKDRIVAYQMEEGTFVCDLEGNVLARLGKRNAPSWTRDGRWLVYMNDQDDGQRILASDLMMVTPDNSAAFPLTNTPNVGEMYPNCSPTENKIVCNTLDGRILLLTYAEDRQ